MSNKLYDYGMVGLGTMGRNLVLNMMDHGYSVAGYDKNPAAVDNLKTEITDERVAGIKDVATFVQSLKPPRVVMLLVPAGKIVDFVIADLKPLIQPGDIIIDCGNSFFKDTQRRVDELAKDGIHFMGMGISGGETGARLGPSIMPGGDETAFKRIAPMLADVAAKVDGEPCTAYMGNGSAGHYVKMVHNGIEYALMQVISEAYHILKVHGGLSNAEMHEVFNRWNNGPLKSFLIEITAVVLQQMDEDGKEYLLDRILDTAAQKGTGAWTSQDAFNIGAAIPSIDASVSQRILSSLKNERVSAAKFGARVNVMETANNKDTLVNDVERALHTAFIIIYAQGLEMLRIASEEYKYGIKLNTVARIWRGGCIIRAELLNYIANDYNTIHDLKNIMLAPDILEALKTGEPALRRIVVKGITVGIPVPGLSSALNYYVSYFSDWLPANMIQAQRDFFGAHTYTRLDKEGIFHTEWDQKVR